MSVLSRLAKTAKAKMSEGGKVALKGAGDAFNRLDELGGEARDSFVEWFEKSPAMGSVRELIRKRRETGEPEPDEVAEPEKVVEAEIVAETVADANVGVQIFGKRSCPWSGRAVRLLEDANIEHQFTELDDPENSGYSGRLVAETKQNTVPYIFVRGDFIGGFNALDELARLGQLEAKINANKDGTSRVKVEVAPRPNTDEVAPAVSGARKNDADA